ncbi:DJ-1/PfpI family protein [Sphingomonas solaris]|uniref:DJ-1/PfpI family protein n=1 Tax=Alterirhizorhabdus solaris TaxID=2529389 RepID=A0A558QSQ3_9SPHN|nr:DJ-1/PfpI family protein [Sphingomonas solaris]TVV70173.1 DJ-1/PfpI family protein [Sphingomonas solaris]
MTTPDAPPLHIGFILFPGITLLDLIGPWEVLTRLNGASCHLVADSLDPVASASGGLATVPTIGFADCPALDVIVVPGGPGHLAAMEDAALLAFLRRQAEGARAVTAVCTGSLVLAAAGLLEGYRATSHWMSRDRLAGFGATPVDARVVVDRDRITGGGVTAGIDFALRLVTLLEGEERARTIQLQIEYAPEPPYAGRPDDADPALVAALHAAMAGYTARMATVDARAAARLARG